MAPPEPERSLIDIAKAIQHPDLEVATHFLSATRDINAAEGRNGFTALHWASVNGHTTLINLLVAHGADINRRTAQGLTAAELACTGFTNPYYEPSGADHETIYRKLLQSGCTYHKLTDHSPSNIIALRDRWFSDASDAWKHWSKNEPLDVCALTPKMLCQFASHGTAEKALQPMLWRNHEPQLRALLASPALTPCHLEQWLKNIPGLAELIQPPATTIQSWSISHSPSASVPSRT